MSGFIYLASPYTHALPDVRHDRYEAVVRAAAELMLRGHVIFSPIAHSHPIELFGMAGEQQDGHFWKRQDVPLLRHATELWVLGLPGWIESSGVRWEIEMAHALHIPIWLLDHKTLAKSPMGAAV